MAMINTDRPKVAQICLATTHEQVDPVEPEKMISDKGVGKELTPPGSKLAASFMHETGRIAVLPANWKDILVRFACDLPGN